MGLIASESEIQYFLLHMLGDTAGPAGQQRSPDSQGRSGRAARGRRKRAPPESFHPGARIVGAVVQTAAPGTPGLVPRLDFHQ